MSASEDVGAVLEACRSIVPPEMDSLKGPDGYESVPLCAVDAIFSIGVKYEGVERVVRRYKEYWSAKGVNADSIQHTTHDFVREFAGRSDLADTVFMNRQRTSTRAGILKADAVAQLLKTLDELEIQTTSQLRNHFDDDQVDRAIRCVHGQGSGVSAKYLFLLAGVEDAVKPDRMIIRFVSKAVGRRVTPLEAQELVVATAKELQVTNPLLTPRVLDHIIWNVQRS